MAGVMQAVDRAQRRIPPVAFVLGVIYKFFDDQGNYLAAIVTYYAFIAIFPLLLLGSSILGFVLQDNAHLQDELLDSALSQFPIIGDSLGRQELTGSTAGIVVGAITALYGAMGLGQAIQNTVNTAWSVPRNSRPNPFLLRLRSLVLLATAGVAVLGVSILSTLFGSTNAFGAQADKATRWLLVIGTIAIVTAMLTVLFRLATTREHSLRNALPGAFAFALMWQLLQYLGTVYVERVIKATSGMNGTFALVLGLMGFIYIAAVMGVLSIEVNVVVARHLWPRALLTPFTDRVDLTEADRRAYAGYALMQRHKGFETVAVTFDGRDGHTHEIVMDPSWLQKATRKLQVRPRDQLGEKLPADPEAPPAGFAPEPGGAAAEPTPSPRDELDSPDNDAFTRPVRVVRRGHLRGVPNEPEESPAPPTGPPPATRPDRAEPDHGESGEPPRGSARR
ncbi:MAG: YihY/virulence factor BrkB family protein [Nocardioides sp.]|uniref:YihY/virulence factor BrkB family protein n=1 Tax=Nocardioides sp. TaxID=35761 RepID=UPI0039E3810C